MHAKDSLSKRQCRLITALFKEFLEILESHKADYDEFYGNLLEKLPNEYKTALILGNPLSEEKFKRLRKKVLDKGNDVLRDSEEELGHFSISFCL
ncbi:MAG: hypothetical protein FMNOHCHN_03591 [Ignavibacteriaceae bacterium]|nr:hypothetical protein [Ignavibacteriaceae bacterium]